MPLQFSSHPVWEIFEEKNLPPEIIAKIFTYNTITVSPINETLEELNQIRGFFETNRLEAPFSSLVDSFTKLCFDYDDYDMEEHVTKYIYRFKHLFYTLNDPTKILHHFIANTYYSISSNYSFIKGLLENMLFYLMRCAYYDQVYFCFEPSERKNTIDIVYRNLIQFREFDNWKHKLNFKIFSQIMSNNFGVQRGVSKSNLIGYCNLFGVKCYKSWTKQKLYHALMTTDATDFDETYLEQCCT